MVHLELLLDVGVVVVVPEQVGVVVVVVQVVL